jgi:hypothetical protein
MDCVCGCGRDISSKLTERNFIAASVALELLAWDKNRSSPMPGPDGREELIARGAACYQRLLDSLHGEGADQSEAACDAWLKESSDLRAADPSMTRRRLLGAGPPNLSEADKEHLDRKHPERSFTRRDDGVGGKLERLRTLRDEGVLTDDEFAAAEARLLGPD